MLHRNKIYAAFIIALPLSGCTTFGSNISGSFSCDAPEGRCAPTQNIDDDALADIANLDDDAPIPAYQQSGYITADAGKGSAPRLAGRRTLKIVFPSRVDARGRLHEAKTVHALAAQQLWVSPPQELGFKTLPEAKERAAASIEGPDTAAANIDGASKEQTPDRPVITRASLKAEAEEKLKSVRATSASTSPKTFNGFDGGAND